MAHPQVNASENGNGSAATKRRVPSKKYRRPVDCIRLRNTMKSSMETGKQLSTAAKVIVDALARNSFERAVMNSFDLIPSKRATVTCHQLIASIRNTAREMRENGEQTLITAAVLSDVNRAYKKLSKELEKRRLENAAARTSRAEDDEEDDDDDEQED